MLPWQPWGLEKEVSSHCPRPGWGGGPVFEPELCQGSWLPLSMSRCGLMEATCLAPWAGEKGSDVCCHSGHFGACLPLLPLGWYDGGSRGTSGPQGRASWGRVALKISEFLPSGKGSSKTSLGPQTTWQERSPLPREPRVTRFCRAGSLDALTFWLTEKLQNSSNY